MAVTAVSIAEVAATGSDAVAGSDNNAGFFDPSTNQANYVADLTTDANTGNTTTPVVSSATFNFVAGDAKSWFFTIGGTGWTLPAVTYSGASFTPTGLFALISSVASNKATLDAAIGHVELYATAGVFAVNDTAGVSTQATPTSGKGCIDYSRAGTPVVSAADLASSNGTNATPTVTSASRTFDKRDIGNHLYISAGTNWTTGIFRITNTSAGGAILDRACGSAASLSSGTYVEGGCLASPGRAGFFHVGGNHIFIKNATYTITTASTNVAAGCLSMTNGSSSQATHAKGYNAFRCDNPKTTSRPLLQAGNAIATFTIIAGQFSFTSFLIADGATLTGSKGFGTGRCLWCTAKNCTATAGFVSVSSFQFFCDATGCSGVSFQAGSGVWYSASWSNTANGFVNYAVVGHCLAVNNTGASSNGFLSTGATGVYHNCTAYGNGQDGFRGASLAINATIMVVDCISYTNAGTQYNVDAATDVYLLVNCAAGLGTGAGNVSTSISKNNQIGQIVLTGDPFVNAAGGNFGLNNTAGAGASCRAAGHIGAFPGLSSTVTYDDIGAVQHQDTGGGGGGAPIVGSSIVRGAGSVL